MIEGNPVVTTSISNAVATLTIDWPPVNALSIRVRQDLLKGLESALADTTVSGIVIMCAGRTFVAGADIKEFSGAPVWPTLHDLQHVIEEAGKPIIAAIHGTALGGGLELALCCHYRIAVPSAKVGLPEVALGLLPGAGGTQRLPRIIGAQGALEAMCFGKPIGAKRALEQGLIDSLADEGKLREDAIAFAREVVEQSGPLQKVRDRDDMLLIARQKPGIFDDFRTKNARSFRGFKAPENIIKAIEAAVTLPFEEGMAEEARLFKELVTSGESAAQRYNFFAERQAAKVPNLSPELPIPTIKHVGVIGAGTMGAGIAMNFLNISMPVALVEQSQEALERGVATIRRNYETSVRKGGLTQEAMGERMALLTPTLDFNALGDCDLVIEAVFERMDVKKDIFGRLDKIAKSGAILATNTSFLDIDAIATATSAPENVVGLHFFSPANVMRLLEVVRGAKTSATVVAAAMQLGRKIGKVAVLSGVCDGFIANRMMAVRSDVADHLILEGPMPWDVDRVLYDYGFPMGHFAMMDLVGLDVIGWDPDSMSRDTVKDILCGLGRFGQKTSGGYYDYGQNRNASPSELVEKFVGDLSRKKGISTKDFDDDKLLSQLLYPVVNEGTKILEEGIAIRASDIDVALVSGYGWPVYTGGPMFWADTIGLGHIVNILDEMANVHGESFRPSNLLSDCAKGGRKLAEL